MLQPFGPDIWLSDGPTVTGAMGFRFPTRMVVIRLPDEGGLWVWSPVAVSENVQAAIDALGPVRYLVAPNNLHYTYLADWATNYPTTQVHAAPRLFEEMAGVTIDQRLSDTPNSVWSDAIDQVLVPGNRITTEIVFFHKASSTMIVTDWLQQIPRGWYRGWRAVVAKLDLMTSSEPSVPRKFRLATNDRNVTREAVQRIVAWDAERLVFAHGPPQSTRGRETFRRAFEWLLD